MDRTDCQGPFWRGPNVSLDILDRTKYQGSFGVDQMPRWMFSTRPVRTWLKSCIKPTRKRVN